MPLIETSGLKVDLPDGFVDFDYHRNGVGGQGFFVALYDDKEFGRMLITRFANNRDEKTGLRSKESPMGGHLITVINLDRANSGIQMFKHSNAWRGDNYVNQMDEAITAWDRAMDQKYNFKYKDV